MFTSGNNTTSTTYIGGNVCNNTFGNGVQFMSFNGNTMVINGTRYTSVMKLTIHTSNEEFNPEEKYVDLCLNVEGDCEEVSTTSGRIAISGKCDKARSTSGSIDIGKDCKDASTTSGSIKVKGNITGRCSTVSGSIKRI